MTGKASQNLPQESRVGCFSELQSLQLEAYFAVSHHPSPSERAELAALVELPVRSITSFFDRRRKKDGLPSMRDFLNVQKEKKKKGEEKKKKDEDEFLEELEGLEGYFHSLQKDASTTIEPEPNYGSLNLKTSSGDLEINSSFDEAPHEEISFSNFLHHWSLEDLESYLKLEKELLHLSNNIGEPQVNVEEQPQVQGVPAEPTKTNSSDSQVHIEKSKSFKRDEHVSKFRSSSIPSIQISRLESSLKRSKTSSFKMKSSNLIRTKTLRFKVDEKKFNLRALGKRCRTDIFVTRIHKRTRLEVRASSGMI